MTTGRVRADKAAASPAPASTPSVGSRFSHIQALRAVAVLLVFGYHLRPDWLPGGYVGVDVFFVISGYLMTAHLLRSTRPGDSFRGAVLGFYSRRIRRILPASLVVLIAVSAVTLITVSRLEWHRYFDEIRASALYYENWSLASATTNYLGGAVTSPVQHFWSLSVEEQFYLGWPVLLAGLGIWLGRFGRRAQLALLVAILVGSLGYSVAVTATNPAVAYFSTFTRLWEFAVGGLCAWFAVVGRYNSVASALLAWLGLAAIALAVLSFTGDTAFPGYAAALPVLGTAAVLAGGDGGPAWGPHALMRLRPVQYVGDISYSVYLWHMPLIVLYPIIIGRALDNLGDVLLVVVTFVLAAASKRFVEDPARRPVPASESRPRRLRPLAVCGGLMAVPVVLAVLAIASVRGDEQAGVRAYTRVTADPPACYGSLTLTRPGCTEQDVPLRGIVPNSFAATTGFDDACQQVGGISTLRTCTFGAANVVKSRVAVVGDSHATHWLPALRALAADRGWRVTTYLKAGCALSTLQTLDGDCVQWNRNVFAALREQRYSHVIVSARSSVFQPGSGETQRRVDGLVQAWRRVQRDGTSIIAIKDVPQPLLGGTGSVPGCVYERGADACAFERARAERLDIVGPATAADPAARLVDLTAGICPATTCRVVIGHVLVYADDSHLTATYVRSMTAQIGRALNAAGLP